MPVGWFELTVDVPQECGDAVANFLIENGAPGVQSEDIGARAAVTAHFRDEPPVEALRRYCLDTGCTHADGFSIRTRRIADEDWAHNWKRHFQPQLIGDRLYVCPPWNAIPPPGRLAIVIDPGMAFGTGHHATTRGCLELLERAVGEEEITRALDVGTGSGVLAIALAKLGVSTVWAVDNDPKACAIAVANAATNACSAIHVSSTLENISGPFDLVTANLFANLLKELAPRLRDLLRPRGILVCSGFLTADEDAVRAAYEAVGFTVVTRREADSWITAALRLVKQ